MNATFRGRPWRDIPIHVAGGAAIAALVAGSWWELLFLPLGASHDGRINARFGLHVRNLAEHGLVGSDYLASLEPFSTQPYTHHPPLMNLLHALSGSILGPGEWQLHLIGYAAGLSTVAALLWLARELGLGAGTSLMALGVVVFTPMFWIYARLGLGVSIMVAFLALWFRQRRVAGNRLALPAAAALTALSSWMGAALVVLTSGLDMWDARNRKVARTVGAVGIGAAALGLVWAATAGEITELAQHTATRWNWPPVTELVERYRWFYGTLFPWWFRWTILPAILVALVNRRTRMAASAVSGALAAWTLVAPDAAYVHDFWTYPLLVPVFLGITAMLDSAVERLHDRRIVAVGAVGLVVLSVVGFTRLGPYRDAYFLAPSDAGALVRDVGPAPGQRTAWVAEGVDPVPRWVSYYWDLPAVEITVADMDAPGDDELVLVRLDELPQWVGSYPVPVDRKGRYILVTGAELRSSR